MKYLLILPILAISGFLVWFLGFSTFSPFLEGKIISPKPQIPEQALQITQPEGGEVVELSSLKISGKTESSSFLAIFSQNNSQILKVPESGEFNTNLNLAEGYNLIKFVNFELNGNPQEADLEVFYLSEKFREITGFSKNATSSAKQQGVIERLGLLRQKQNLKIMAGSVKGILGKNLALETRLPMPEGEAAGGQAKLQSRTVVVDSQTQIRNFSDFGKKLELSQIQAQDFVVAVGIFAQQGILTAKILLINPDKALLFGKVAKFGIVTRPSAGGEKNSFELTDPQTGKTENIQLGSLEIFNEQNQKIEAKKLEVGNKLVLTGKLEKEQITAEKILQIPGNFLIELEKFATPPLTTQSATPSAR